MLRYHLETDFDKEKFERLETNRRRRRRRKKTRDTNNFFPFCFGFSSFFNRRSSHCTRGFQFHQCNWPFWWLTAISWVEYFRSHNSAVEILYHTWALSVCADWFSWLNHAFPNLSSLNFLIYLFFSVSIIYLSFFSHRPKFNNYERFDHIFHFAIAVVVVAVAAFFFCNATRCATFLTKAYNFLRRTHLEPKISLNWYFLLNVSTFGFLYLCLFTLAK